MSVSIQLICGGLGSLLENITRPNSITNEEQGTQHTGQGGSYGDV